MSIVEKSDLVCPGFVYFCFLPGLSFLRFSLGLSVCRNATAVSYSCLCFCLVLSVLKPQTAVSVPHAMFFVLSYCMLISSSHVLFLLPPVDRRNLDPGSLSRPLPLRAAVRAFLFIGRRLQLFLPAPTRVELCFPCYKSAFGSWCLWTTKISTPKFEPRTLALVGFKVNHYQ